MKLLKTLNRINALALGAYVPYIIIFHNDFFFGKERGNGIGILSLIIFLITFICGFVILMTASHKNVDNSFSIAEVLTLGKGKLIPLISVWAIGIILIILYINDASEWFYIICSTVTLIFVLAESVIIKKIDVSPYFKVCIPWYTYPLPFFFFLVAVITIINTVPEEKIDFPIIAVFVLSGILMAFIAWQTCFYIDEQSKTIEKEYGGLVSLFKKNIVVPFDRITLVKKKRMLYIIRSDNEEFRINRLFSSVRRMEKAFYDNGIPIQ
ncbi:MAG: hypothetical protein IKN26_04140 [Eubacterium sp.]|nr:hypothetical protein [Eubacterium sp.]MBR4241150.1 hypothetical protein [Eubacterium sp.]MBR7060722.1 hypothetical protein [Eubacterium sp.]